MLCADSLQALSTPFTIKGYRRMTKLAISKNTEAITVATIWNMGVESLDPDSYSQLERILDILCETRNIDFKTVGIEHQVLSGKNDHYSDCSIHNAPAMLPSPCDCNYLPNKE